MLFEFRLFNHKFKAMIFVISGSQIKSISLLNDEPVALSNRGSHLEFLRFKSFKLNDGKVIENNLLIINGDTTILGDIELPNWDIAATGNITIKGKVNCRNSNMKLSGTLVA